MYLSICIYSRNLYAVNNDVRVPITTILQKYLYRWCNRRFRNIKGCTLCVYVIFSIYNHID